MENLVSLIRYVVCTRARKYPESEKRAKIECGLVWKAHALKENHINHHTAVELRKLERA
jgi:hypothetical protein